MKLFSFRDKADLHRVLAFARENHPAIKRGRTTLAAATRFYSNCIGNTLEQITQANVIIANEARQTYAIRLTLTLFPSVALVRFLLHNVHSGKSRFRAMRVQISIG